MSEYYFKVPDWVAMDTSLNLSEKMVFCLLLSFWRNGKKKHSNLFLAWRLGMSESSVKRAKNGLKKKKLIAWKDEKFKVETEYTYVYDKTLGQSALAQNEPTQGHENTGNPVQNASDTLGQSALAQSDPHIRLYDSKNMQMVCCNDNDKDYNLKNRNKTNAYAKSSKDPYEVSFNWK